MTDKIQHEGKTFELTGEFRQPAVGEWYLCLDRAFRKSPRDLDGGRAILREVQAPSPFDAEGMAYFDRERNGIHVKAIGDGRLRVTVAGGRGPQAHFAMDVQQAILTDLAEHLGKKVVDA